LAPLVVLVEFQVKPEFVDQFGALILANARDSLKHETGCQRFDVLVGPDDQSRFVLYEIYENDRAFDLHLCAPHYLTFAKAIEGQIEHKSVRRLRLCLEQTDRGSAAGGARA
jgi:(4S)-4-hydroxy-5-phosphonooxypentane-2,3-dione isomerase